MMDEKRQKGRDDNNTVTNISVTAVSLRLLPACNVQVDDITSFHSAYVGGCIYSAYYRQRLRQLITPNYQKYVSSLPHYFIDGNTMTVVHYYIFYLCNPKENPRKNQIRI